LAQSSASSKKVAHAAYVESERWPWASPVVSGASGAPESIWWSERLDV
jgi:hypothetical protein